MDHNWSFPVGLETLQFWGCGRGVRAASRKPHHLYLFSFIFISSHAPLMAVLLLTLGFWKFHFAFLCFCLIWSLPFTWLFSRTDISPVDSMLVKMLYTHQKYVTDVIFISVIVSHSPFFRWCRGIYGLVIKRTIFVPHNLTLFLNTFSFFFPSPPLLCVLAFQNRVWQRKWGSNILFFVLKLLRWADCVFIGCELQDVVSGSSLSADPTSGLFWEILSRADCKMQGWTLSKG